MKRKQCMVYSWPCPSDKLARWVSDWRSRVESRSHGQLPHCFVTITGATLRTLNSQGSTSLAKWIVTGIKDEKVKACREAFKPTLKRKSEFLVNPTLDESIYLRLKASKTPTLLIPT
ncbi:hypothetical protein OUZ56_023861 [Daphnia magna]|uniref:Uncharacterized protein n=1 Tax=Daphnia magna TaxID=35525 RepID=A0ABR0AZR6_9CRUS|nr:hypothetical protein OUZ56_023861 [Daphnia magna]